MAKLFNLIKNVLALSLLDDITQQGTHGSNIVAEFCITRDHHRPTRNLFLLSSGIEQRRVGLEERRVG